MILGLTPARGGSKGIPGKNIRLVRGKPLIAYTIECAKKVTILDEYIVSTEDKAIADVAREYGAKVPFMRPKELAEDSSPTMPVIQHAISEIEALKGRTVEVVVLLEPTAPLRAPIDIEESYKIFSENDCDLVVSCNESHRNPYFNMIKKRGKYYELVNQGGFDVGRRQDAPLIYDLNPVVWIFSRRAIMDQTRLPKKTLMYKIPSERSIDIDTFEDLEYLEFKLEKKKNAKQRN
jgi:CMP-N,N'-diacetyllegionaminic acid synthase